MARILVIDDDSLIRETLRRMLEGAGHEVTEAEDGAAGLKAVKAQRPDLVVTDIYMPGKEGIETIRELRQIVPGLKIIAISGSSWSSGHDALSSAKLLGADRTLPKPFRKEQLLASIRDCLQG
jgi:two-component system, chemotaxis family, chemotaxis protein CheY